MDPKMAPGIVSPNEVQRALQTIDGMTKFVEAEMLTRGSYVSEGAKGTPICGGHKACLLGSAWLAYGADVRTVRRTVSPPQRRDYLRMNPALALVYDALNDEALAMVARDPLPRFKQRYIQLWDSPAEGLFETLLPFKDVPELLAGARARIEAEYPGVGETWDTPVRVPELVG